MTQNKNELHNHTDLVNYTGQMKGTRSKDLDTVTINQQKPATVYIGKVFFYCRCGKMALEKFAHANHGSVIDASLYVDSMLSSGIAKAQLNVD